MKKQRPEWKLQMLICTLVLAEKLSTRLGQIATVWATTILLGGFVSGLSSSDFWVISAMALASTLRLFGSTQEHKLNQKRRQRRRHVLVKWLFGKHFYISFNTVIAGSLDLLMYVLQLASAIVSLVLSILRISRHNFGGSAQGANQKGAMMLYYTMVLAEAMLFLSAKICWELPLPREHKGVIIEMTYDRERQAIIFGLFDEYFVKVLTTARETSVVQGLEMSLRGYISDMLVQEESSAAACILILETLYEPGEWIKAKADAHKRAKLLPFLFQHIDITSDHESREAAISLVTSLLVSKTNAPEQCKFGPLVLLKALDSHPKAVDILTGESSLGRPVAKYLKTCLESGNKHEVSLGIDVVKRLPAEFLLSTHIVEVMAEQILKAPPSSSKHRHLPAMMVLTLGEHGLLSGTEVSVRASQAVEVLLKRTRIRELEILVGLDTIGLLSQKQKQRVSMGNFFRKENLMRCLPWIVEWVSSLDDDTFHEVFRKLKSATKEGLLKRVEASRVKKFRPDLIKFCRLLVRDSFFKSRIEQSPSLMQLLEPEEEC